MSDFLCADWWRALIDKCTDHEYDVMVAKFVSLCLVHVTFQEISKEMDVKTVSAITTKKNQQQFLIVCSVIDHGNDDKTFKTLQGNQSPAAC